MNEVLVAKGKHLCKDVYIDLHCSKNLKDRTNIEIRVIQFAKHSVFVF